MNVYEWVKKNVIIGYKCEECDTKMNNPLITLIFGFGHDLDEEEYHFCSESHAIRFLANELRKKNPRTNIEFGKEKS